MVDNPNLRLSCFPYIFILVYVSVFVNSKPCFQETFSLFLKVGYDGYAPSSAHYQCAILTSELIANVPQGIVDFTDFRQSGQRGDQTLPKVRVKDLCLLRAPSRVIQVGAVGLEPTKT